MTLPMPTLDHVVINVRSHMDEAQAVFGRLGFTLTPRGYHTLGSMNHLAIFGTDYLELIGAQAGNEERADILGWPMGLNGLVFGTEDSAGLYAALREAGVPVREPIEFSRPVELSDGRSRDAVFRTVRLPHEAVPGNAGRLYFCQHFTRDLVWRDEWRRHANGAVGVERTISSARDPKAMGALYRQMFGPAAVRTITGGVSLTVGMSRFDVVTPDVLEEALGTALAEPDERSDRMAVLVFKAHSLAGAEAALRAGTIEGVREGLGGLVVPASSACGATLVFVE